MLCFMQQIHQIIVFKPSDLMAMISALCSYLRLLMDPSRHQYNQALSPIHSRSHLCLYTYGTSDNPTLSDCSHTVNQIYAVVSPCEFQSHTYCIRYAVPLSYTTFRPAFSRLCRKSLVSKTPASGSLLLFVLFQVRHHDTLPLIRSSRDHPSPRQA